MSIWGACFGGGTDGSFWSSANTGGRGSTYQQENVPRMGGVWYFTTRNGSRSSTWINHPASRNVDITARGVCGHYAID